MRTSNDNLLLLRLLRESLPSQFLEELFYREAASVSKSLTQIRTPEINAPGHPPGGQHVVGARGLVAVSHSGALAQEQRPVVTEIVMIPGILHSLDLQVLRCVPVIGQLSQYWPLIG